MSTIICISDTHLTSPSSKSLSYFPYYLSLLSPEKAEKIYQDYRSQCDHAHEAALKEIAIAQPNAIIHLGDLTGGWRESGLTHESVQMLAKQAVKKYRTITKNFFICWGNHDLGYGKESGGGINIQSIKICEEISPLFWAYEIENVVVIGTCSSLSKYQGTDLEILEYKRKQEQFLEITFQKYSNKKWILCDHEYSSPFYMHTYLNPHAANLQSFIYGDLHNPKVTIFVKSLLYLCFCLPFFRRAGLSLDFIKKGILCPSTAPVWSDVYKLLTLHIEKEHVSSQIIKVSSKRAQIHSPSIFMDLFKYFCSFIFKSPFLIPTSPPSPPHQTESTIISMPHQIP